MLDPVTYDEDLAARVRDLLRGESDVAEQRMFGGLAFLVSGHMAVVASGRGGLMIRHDPDPDSEDFLSRPHVEPVEMRGRPMTGFLRVDDAGLADDEALAGWVRVGVERARALPPKA